MEQQRIRYDISITFTDGYFVRNTLLLTPNDVQYGYLKSFINFVLDTLKVQHITVYGSGNIIADKEYTL